MKYPYLLYQTDLKHASIFPGLAGNPYVADLSFRNPILDTIDVRDQKRYQAILANEMAPHHSWGLSGYLERRDSLLRDCEQMVSEKRFYHLGLDIIVPVGRELHAPLDAVAVGAGYETGEGNYGGFVILRHESADFDAFYSFYGHLNRSSLPDTGRRFTAGEPFARVGDFHENGNWFHHTHLQVITEKGLAAGYAAKGYCAAEDLPEMNDLCPSPIPLFRR
ncbi:MAG: peptidoglycan DD-metalloendopeptidase family protein [Desulfobacterales bacterium]